jgi:transcriptional regulator of aromatic amino acid metabolism
MFGNLGSRLNKLISELQTFDRIKQQKYLLERVKTKNILEMLDKPIYILDGRLEFDTYNEAFGDAFNIDPKTFDPGELEELVQHVQKNADIYSKSVRNESFKEKIDIKGIDYQVEFNTIPILHSGEEKKLYAFIFEFSYVKKIGKTKK